eukprot:TRINITY_DN9668_c0_g1::TRINITY_DN9668_c0_g1_i1::g.10118::m.10118 TRINITY_DN9668_c0_g1::TRINITY_DN9668_c0_g1_i1::g.10118  ORF type:complete len:254 (+),score=35.75,DUF2370/PF10176.4/0.012,CbtB/PF09489.5/1.5e+03,CbtB/PF09489.5/0.49,EGF_2/PF07974.8/0.23,DUF2874/PF11396.3/0.75,DUF2874/PF11396.3/5.7e+02,Nucleoplasmin/PF03066.10/1,DUF2457/PF10446.4/3.1,CENP-B_dimeris/PF09026.5/9.8e+03,CENP-B_dimeris/PF09026.5/2.7,Cwf_Cwc_15/PF04889.7/5.1 TRINITY_DN9668_c0_g1_i1:64-825(+)
MMSFGSLFFIICALLVTQLNAALDCTANQGTIVTTTFVEYCNCITGYYGRTCESTEPMVYVHLETETSTNLDFDFSNKTTYQACVAEYLGVSLDNVITYKVNFKDDGVKYEIEYDSSIYTDKPSEIETALESATFVTEMQKCAGYTVYEVDTDIENTDDDDEDSDDSDDSEDDDEEGNGTRRFVAITIMILGFGIIFGAGYTFYRMHNQREAYVPLMDFSDKERDGQQGAVYELDDDKPSGRSQPPLGDREML